MQKSFAALLALALAAIGGPLAAATSPVIAPPMVTIPGGEFAMGNADDPVNADYPASVPVHKVRIKSFRLAKYETTVLQFRQFIEATGYQMGSDCWKLASNEWGMEYGNLSWNSPAIARSDYQPVMCVSQKDAQAYVQWLSKETGKRYRLPSEAEWEYAARGGSKNGYAFRDKPAELCKHANVFDRTGKAAIAKLTGKTASEPVDCDDHAELTTVVGMYQPNAFGLHDMLGNAGELVQDCQHLTYENAPTDGSAWTDNCKAFHGGAMAIHRGGNYNNRVVGASPTARGHAGTDNRSSVGEGFRIAEDVAGDVAGSSQPGTFEAGLARAQAAERSRQAAPQ